MGGTTANPAMVYCALLGYDSKIVDTESGQQGMCLFPDESSCDEWDFYAGKCGEAYSYCGQEGYGIKTLSDGNDPYSQEYAVCLDEQATVVGSVSELSGLRKELEQSQSE